MLVSLEEGPPLGEHIHRYSNMHNLCHVMQTKTNVPGLLSEVTPEEDAKTQKPKYRHSNVRGMQVMCPIRQGCGYAAGNYK